MLVSELQVGQNVTAGFWWNNYNGDEYSIIRGTVIKTLPCYGSAQVAIEENVFGPYNRVTALLSNKAEIISINNNQK